MLRHAKHMQQLGMAIEAEHLGGRLRKLGGIGAKAVSTVLVEDQFGQPGPVLPEVGQEGFGKHNHIPLSRKVSAGLPLGQSHSSY